MNSRPVQYINDGEPVSGGVTNRPISQVQQNVQRMDDYIRSAQLGTKLIIPDAVLDPACVVGTPVYRDLVSKTFKPSLANFTGTTGVVTPTASAQVWGIVIEKSSSTVGTILIEGFAKIDLSLVSTDAPASGLYYLSGSLAGKLVQQRQPVSVPVLMYDGEYALVRPVLPDLLDRHVHYRYSLVCLPAGTNTVVSGKHVIASPNANLPGWLPANHAVFGGKAPTGAAFGYNLSKHTALQNIWPPIPVDNAWLSWDRGKDAYVGGTSVPLGYTGLCIMDQNGIWWMSNLQNHVPWLATRDISPNSVSNNRPPTVEWPTHLTMQMLLFFTRPSYVTDVNSVTSLKSKDPRIVLQCANGLPGTSGDLTVDLNLDFVTVEDEIGYLALKNIDGNNFKRGPVVEGIYTLDPNLALNGDANRRVIPGDVSSPLMYQGKISISTSQAAEMELPLQTVRVEGVETQYFEGTPYFGFAPAENSEVRCAVHVPNVLGFNTPKLAFRLHILGRIAGGLPNLQVTARKIPKTTGLTPLALPLSGTEFSVSLTNAATLSATNQYVVATTGNFTVAAGDLVMFTIKRVSTDGYAGEVGLMSVAPILTAS